MSTQIPTVRSPHSRRILAMLAPAVLLSAAVGCTSLGTNTMKIPLERSEAEVTEDEVPEAALASLRKLADGRAITGIEREDRGAFRAWEAEWTTADGDDAEATVLDDGSVVERSRSITATAEGEVPPAVRERIEELRDAGWTVEISRREFVTYELDLTRSVGDGEEEEEHEVLIRPDGGGFKTN